MLVNHGIGHRLSRCWESTCTISTTSDLLLTSYFEQPVLFALYGIFIYFDKFVPTISTVGIYHASWWSQNWLWSRLPLCFICNLLITLHHSAQLVILVISNCIVISTTRCILYGSTWNTGKTIIALSLCIHHMELFRLKLDIWIVIGVSKLWSVHLSTIEIIMICNHVSLALSTLATGCTSYCLINSEVATSWTLRLTRSFRLYCIDTSLSASWSTARGSLRS